MINYYNDFFEKENHLQQPVEISFDNEIKELTHQIKYNKSRIRSKDIFGLNSNSQDAFDNHCRSCSNELIKSIYSQYVQNRIPKRNSASTDYNTSKKDIKMNIWNKLYYKGIEFKKKQMVYSELMKRKNELSKEKECPFRPVITSIKYHSKTNSQIWQIDNFIQKFNVQMNETNISGVNYHYNQLKEGLLQYQRYNKKQEEKGNRKKKNTPIVLSDEKKRKCRSRVMSTESEISKYNSKPLDNHNNSIIIKGNKFKSVDKGKQINRSYTQQYKSHYNKLRSKKCNSSASKK